MNKTLLGVLALLSLLLTQSLVGLEAAELVAGTDYDLVKPAQPTQDPQKIEVLEFFWYGCPHCLEFEPDLNAWIKTKLTN